MARTQTNIIAKNEVEEQKNNHKAIGEKLNEKNIAVVRSLINKMLVYSAIKISANLPALYSTLNPETNSDSPSARSNGVRLVSARMVVNHIIVRGMENRALNERDVDEINDKSNDACRIRGEIRIRAILTS